MSAFGTRCGIRSAVAGAIGVARNGRVVVVGAGRRFAHVDSHAKHSSDDTLAKIELTAASWPSELASRKFTAARFGIKEPAPGTEKVYSGEETVEEPETALTSTVLRLIAVVATLFAAYKADEAIYPDRYNHPLNKMYRKYIAEYNPEDHFSLLGEEYRKQHRIADDHRILHDTRAVAPPLNFYSRRNLIESDVTHYPSSIMDMSDVERKIDEINSNENRFLSSIKSSDPRLYLPKRYFS